MKYNALLIGAALFGSLLTGCSKPDSLNQALYDYLGKPVAPPANLEAAYTKEGLLAAIQDAAQAANISIVKTEIDDSEFPFLVGVVCANRSDKDKLEGQLRRMTNYDYGGGVGGNTVTVMNIIPYRTFPGSARQQIEHRLMLREAIFYDRINGNP